MKSVFPSLPILVVASLLVQVAHGEDAYRLLVLEGRNVKWGPPELGAPAWVTYAVLDGTATTSGVRNCKSTRGVEPLLTHSGLSRDVLEEELESAVASWEKVANVRFRLTADIASANILVGAQTAPEGWAYADVRTVESHSGGLATIAKGIVCINPERAWRARDAGIDAEETFDLRYVLKHEIGHLLGLDHPGATGGLMSFRYDEKFYELQPGDIAGAIALYGPSEEAPTPLFTTAGAFGVRCIGRR